MTGLERVLRALGRESLLDPLRVRLTESRLAFRNSSTPELLASIDDLVVKDGPSFDVRDGAVCVGDPARQPDGLEGALERLMPWRKGPFEIAGIQIDAEWRADIKWERLQRMIPRLEGKVVADIGCNNGYYMYRMLEHRPSWVLGFDPTTLYALQYRLVHRFAPDERLVYERLGAEELTPLKGVFDVVFLLGILYHQTDPIGLLRDLHGTLTRQGEIVIETIVIPGTDSMCLLPERRYAGARGFYFLPTLPALLTLIRRAGFRIVDHDEPVLTTAHEQRATRWRNGASLPEGLNPEDPELTIEGYPAPRRVIVRAAR